MRERGQRHPQARRVAFAALLLTFALAAGACRDRDAPEPGAASATPSPAARVVGTEPATPTVAATPAAPTATSTAAAEVVQTNYQGPTIARTQVTIF